MNVTVFGGTLPKPGQPAYDEALRLGRLLAQRGCTVLTGGYMGTMEAVSRGAAEAGGHVIGVTCTEIERWRSATPNAWVKEEWRRETLQDRMTALMDYSEAALALPGGVGTLAEITLMWNRMVVDAVPRRPLVLIGRGWRVTIDGLFSAQKDYFAEHIRALLQYAPTVEDAVNKIA